MKNYLKLLLVVIILLISFTVAFAQVAQAKKKIGILMWSHDQRYQEVKYGFMEELKDQGFVEPGVEYVEGFAGENKAKAQEVAQKFAAEKFDLCVSFGTSATTALMKEVKDIPVIFALVYDPVKSKIAASWESSGNNSTGLSNFVPMSKVLEVLKRMAKVEYLAVVYTPGETNSETELKDLQDLSEEFGLKIIPVPVRDKQELLNVMPYALAKAEALFITGSGVANNSVEEMVGMSFKAKVITVTHLLDHSQRGALLGVGLNYQDMGRLAAKKATLVMQGQAASTIPIERMGKFHVVVNMKTAKAAQIVIPPEFLKSADKIIE